MIRMLRLDERLIHGQIAIKWSRHLEVNRIIVANDKAYENEVVRKSLMMAAPGNIKVAIKSVSESISILNDPRAVKLKILVIVSNPDDLLKVVENTTGVEEINIGNYGRIAPKKGTRIREAYGANLYCYDSEVKILNDVIASGIKTTYQTTPENIPEDLKKVLNK